MQLSQYAPVALMLLIGQAYSVPTTNGVATRDVIQELGEVTITHELQAFPDGPKVYLNGTIQEVHKRLLEINPNYDNDFQFGKVDGLRKRTDFSGAKVHCAKEPTDKWGMHNGALSNRIKDGVDYLNKLKPEHPANMPGGCGKVSCSWDSAIWWCNHVSFEQLASFAHYASFG